MCGKTGVFCWKRDGRGQACWCGKRRGVGALQKRVTSALEGLKKRNGSSGIPEVPATLNGSVQCHIALKLDVALKTCKPFVLILKLNVDYLEIRVIRYSEIS